MKPREKFTRLTTIRKDHFANFVIQCPFLSCFFGNAFSVAAMIANGPDAEEVLQALEVTSTFGVLFRFVEYPALFIEIMQATFHPMDVLFYLIAIYTGFKYSFHGGHTVE